jgi:hypothetical protein
MSFILFICNPSQVVTGSKVGHPCVQGFNVFFSYDSADLLMLSRGLLFVSNSQYSETNCGNL